MGATATSCGMEAASALGEANYEAEVVVVAILGEVNELHMDGSRRWQISPDPVIGRLRMPDPMQRRAFP